MAKKKTRQKQKKINLPRQRVIRKKVRTLTFGITDALSTTLLYFLYVTVTMPGGRSGPMGVHQAFNKADNLLAEFDAKKIRKALSNLRQRGFIKTLKEEATLPKITETGMKRLQNRFPFYDEKRTWDNNLYIITYDIPVKANQKRTIFRNSLTQLKAVKLQDSVYLTPYNPREIIRQLIEEYDIPSQILVSTLDPHDAFGARDIKEFLWEIYDLAEVNDRYALFIGHHTRLKPKDVKTKKMQLKIAFEYLSILQDDPQIPFKLLPDEYLGDEAYILFKKLMLGR